jgi:hypothetical protein
VSVEIHKDYDKVALFWRGLTRRVGYRHRSLCCRRLLAARYD